MPALDDEAMPPGLRALLVRLADDPGTDQRAADAVLAQAQAIVRAHSSADAAEYDAIGLALDAVRREMGDASQP